MFCQCGCGQLTRVSNRNRKEYGHIKGEPVRFIHGHKGWVGDKITYCALHTYLRRHYLKTGICEHCNLPSNTQFALIHNREYSRNRKDYLELCFRCHSKYDRKDKNANTTGE